MQVWEQKLVDIMERISCVDMCGLREGRHLFLSVMWQVSVWCSSQHRDLLTSLVKNMGL